MNPAITPLGPLRRTRLLIVGCGDVGLRVLVRVRSRLRVIALTSNPDRRAELRAAGALPLLADLDRPATLGRLGALAGSVLHLAPPPNEGEGDPRTAALLRALARGGVARRIVYASTTGVYGDCRGARIDETRAVAPATGRGRRRVDAEARLRHHGRACGACVTLLRIPGIYAFDRAGGDPRERVRRAAPVLAGADDVYTNHIHADDLARACLRALFLGRPQRVVNVCDDSELRMGDYFDLVADLFGLARPPRLTRDEACRTLSPLTMSFLSESRRIGNRRCKAELRLRLRHPTVREAAAAWRQPALPGVPPAGAGPR
jgi:nucleoside-diphosphate-sugar epimerase